MPSPYPTAESTLTLLSAAAAVTAISERFGIKVVVIVPVIAVTDITADAAAAAALLLKECFISNSLQNQIIKIFVLNVTITF